MWISNVQVCATALCRIKQFEIIKKRRDKIVKILYNIKQPSVTKTRQRNYKYTNDEKYIEVWVKLRYIWGSQRSMLHLILHYLLAHSLWRLNKKILHLDLQHERGSTQLSWNVKADKPVHQRLFLPNVVPRLTGRGTEAIATIRRSLRNYIY